MRVELAASFPGGAANASTATKALPMKVNVVLFATLERYQPDGAGGRHARTFELPEGTTIANVITTLGLPDEPRLIFVNSRHADGADALHDGDRLAIFPPVAGG